MNDTAKPAFRSLDTRIADALNGEIVTSASLSDLIIAVEDALPQNAKAAEAERVRMLDPTNPDSEKSRQMLDRIALERERLQAALPMLEARYRKAEHHESRQALLPSYNEVVENFNETSVALTTAYLEFCERFVPMLSAAVELNNRIRKMNAQASGLGLTTIPLIAEGLLEGIVLPSPNGVYWPDPRRANAIIAQWADAMAQAYASPLRQIAASGDWWAAKQADDERKIAEWQKRNELLERQQAEAKAEFERSKQGKR